MRSFFPGHFPASDEELDTLWSDAVIAFDANVLLGFYRYSDSTRTDFFRILALVKNRCWLPHQAVKEYFRNRLTNIRDQEKTYTEAISAIQALEAQFKVSHRHPFLSSGSLTALCQQFQTTVMELEDSRFTIHSRITKDDLLPQIETIFQNRVGPPFDSSEESAIIAEGARRYSRKIPPGYSDAGKDDPSDPTKPFGDLILWKQLLANEIATSASSDK